MCVVITDKHWKGSLRLLMINQELRYVSFNIGDFCCFIVIFNYIFIWKSGDIYKDVSRAVSMSTVV